MASAARSQSAYSIVIDTSAVEGKAGRLVFTLASNSPRTNRADIFHFGTDATIGLAETHGGLVAGDLALGSFPAPFTRIAGGHFLNELELPVESFGTRTQFIVDVSESGPGGELVVPDKFAFYLLDSEGNSLARGVEAGDPHFTILIDGERGGVLDVLGRTAAKRQKLAVDRREAGVDISISPIWITREEENALPALSFEGEMVEFCTRRCVGEEGCSGGEFGVTMPDGKILRFDDLGNLKARVALVEKGLDDVRVTVRVSAVPLSNTVLRVRAIEILL
jgi:hypothetical protein